ncbi:MAG: hypothetical protein K6D02_08755 [Lachnospiraceae bacterium]|nr:hypothetical protein [Lachnospiraceae bacterium]
MKRLSKAVIALIIIACICIPVIAGVVIYSSNKKNNPTKVTSTKKEEPKKPVSRTLLLYTCGSDLELNDGFLTKNLKEIMSSKMPENLNVIVMTGGTRLYHMEKKYTVDENGKNVEIIPEQKQIWKLTGSTDGKPGKMILLETRKDLEKNSYISSVPLQNLIDYSVENYPADKYDLTFWGHGFGVFGCCEDYFEQDEKYMDKKYTMAEMIKAFKDSKLKDKFEIINFDCCLMGSTEVAYALSDYADYFIGSAETIPAPGQGYKDWIEATGEDPTLQGYELGKTIVDIYKKSYDDKDNEYSAYDATLNVVDTEKFVEKMTPALTKFIETMIKEAKEKGENDRYNFYDEIVCANISTKYKDAIGAVDLGNYAEALSICLTERDNISDDDKKNLTNNYTEAAKEVLEVLNDPEVRYCKNNETFTHTVKNHFYRDENGKVVSDEKLEPYGLSIYLPFDDDMYFSEYMTAMDELIEVFKDNDKICKLYKDLKEEASLYNSIYLCGKKISELACDGKYDTSFEDVVKELMLDENYDADWLKEIVAQQNEEVVKGDGETFAVKEDLEDGNMLISSDTASLRTLDMARPFFQQYIIKANEKIYEDDLFEETVEEKLISVLGEDDCELNPESLDKDQDNVIAERAALYEKNGVSFISKKYDGTWYQLTDAKGTTHLACIQYADEDKTSVNIPLVEYEVHNEGKKNECKEEESMQFTAKITDDKNLEITEINQLDLWGPKPFKKPKKNKYSKGYFTGYGKNFYLELVRLNKDFPVSFDTDKENFGITIQKDAKIKDMDNVTDKQVKSLEQRICVTDIYGVDHVVCTVK